MKARFETITSSSLFALDGWKNKERNTLYAGDVYHPWHSVHGFAFTAARLAAGQELLLSCREDEVFELMARLNALLARPEVIERALYMLVELEQQTFQKLRLLLELEDRPISQAETEELVESVEQLLAQPFEPVSTGDRLEEMVAPNQVTDEIAGLRTMLGRLQVLIPALERVKESGFHVVVLDRRRQPAQPALETRRNELIQNNGGPTGDVPGGFLLPARYHLTLWNYLVARNDGGQSAVWN